jgi:poly(3-hydroxybutyrate) depolymerase
VDRVSERRALIFDHSTDAFELWQHLHGNCTPRRHAQVARVHCRRAHGPDGHGDIPVYIYESLSTHTTPGANSHPALVVYFHGGGLTCATPPHAMPIAAAWPTASARSSWPSTTA